MMMKVSHVKINVFKVSICKTLSVFSVMQRVRLVIMHPNVKPVKIPISSIVKPNNA